MARSMVANSKMLLLREAKQGGRSCLRSSSSSVAGVLGKGDRVLKDQVLEKRIDHSWWMPHPRSGIYYPVGHERVMDDVPEGAARSDITHWLRGSDGVAEPSHDPSFHGY